MRPPEEVFHIEQEPPAETRTKTVNGKEYLVPYWIKHPEDWDPTTEFCGFTDAANDYFLGRRHDGESRE